MYLLRRLSPASFPTIGEHFHRDHSTVIYAVALIERRLERDAAFRHFVEELETQIIQATKEQLRDHTVTSQLQASIHLSRPNFCRCSSPGAPSCWCSQLGACFDAGFTEVRANTAKLSKVNTEGEEHE
jgi:hypothetical protein